MKEELSKQTAKLRKMLGLTHQPLPRLPSPQLQPKPTPDGGSKRNLINTLEEATNIEKKPRMDAVVVTKRPPLEESPPRRRLRGRKARLTRGSDRDLPSQQITDTPPTSMQSSPPTSSTRSGLEHLLLAAGLKVNVHPHTLTHTHTHTHTHSHVHSPVTRVPGLPTAISVRLRWVWSVSTRLGSCQYSVDTHYPHTHTHTHTAYPPSGWRQILPVPGRVSQCRQEPLETSQGECVGCGLSEGWADL